MISAVPLECPACKTRIEALERTELVGGQKVLFARPCGHRVPGPPLCAKPVKGGTKERAETLECGKPRGHKDHCEPACTLRRGQTCGRTPGHEPPCIPVEDVEPPWLAGVRLS